MYREFQFFDTISNISTYSRELTKTVELFPRTEITHKNHARPIPANIKNEKYRPDIKVSLSFHVESVARMSGRISRRSGKNVNKVLPI
jgi:hypothetical protein